MVEITEYSCSRGATEDEICGLEQGIGFRLPEDYRTFLRSINGGRPLKKAFACQVSKRPCGAAVQFLFTLDRGGDPYVISENLRVYSGRIPGGTVPIGCDSFGNLILLDVGAHLVGAVYFWDHENENMDGEPSWENICHVASSFTEFIEMLK